MELVLKEWLAKYPKARIRGHRDFPGVKKACPQFIAEKEYGYDGSILSGSGTVADKVLYLSHYA